MQIGVRDLRNRTAEVIEAVRSGELVTLTVHGVPVADVVPHGGRDRWVSGPLLWQRLESGQADARLSLDLDRLAGETLVEE